jgi:hypothetical protein
MTDSEQQLIYNAYAAFNSRNIDAALRLMHPQVQWPNGWEGGWVHGHDEVRAYWTRQWQVLDPHVTPVAIVERDDGRLEVQVHQVVKDIHGALLMDGPVIHVYTIDKGFIIKMEIEEP